LRYDKFCSIYYIEHTRRIADNSFALSKYRVIADASLANRQL